MAVIDMGSNSFRLVVFAYERGSRWKLIDEIREAVRVSAGMGDERLLKAEPVERALGTAAVFASFLRASGVTDVVAVATSAIRDARNGEQLLAAIRAHTQLEPRVISGEDEARYAYLAIVNSTTLERGCGVEIGGGSAQLMGIRDRRLEHAASFPFGAVRVSERFLPGEKATGKRMKALRRHVGEVIAGERWFSSGGGGRLAGVGGAVRNLAAAAQKANGHPETDVGGFTLTRDALADLIDELAASPSSKRGSVPGIKPDRGDVILGAALVLDELMAAGGFEGVEVTEAGLREGIFFERLLAPADPPLFDDVRRQSVCNLARQFGIEPHHVGHVAKLSLEIYDGLAEGGVVRWDPVERELLWAACNLHDIGVAVDYDDHHKHSHYLILSAGLPGFTPRELILIALITRYHRKGDPDSSELGPLAERDDAARLRLLSGVIRLAEQLERSRDGAVGAVSLAAADGTVRLAAEAREDASVALWSARRNADLLAGALGREVEIELSG